jgi:3-oxoacyl-[acyl-carrier-protein] synthase II
MSSKRVVVTGYGAVCALGENVPAIWDSIMEYRVGYSRIDMSEANVQAKFFGFMAPDRKRYANFSKTLLKMAPTFAKNALVASREALDMAFGTGVAPTATVSPFDIGVIIGTGWGGTDSIIRNRDEFRELGITTSFATLMSMHSIGTGLTSLNWNLRGYQNTPIAACATGTMAIGDAYEIIHSGRQKVMLAGGSESLVEGFNGWSIDVTQALSKAQDDPTLACCPFDNSRSGFVLSEGAAVLCLEELEHALARNATILGEVTGYANCSDAYDMTAPADDMQARVQVIQRSLANAGRDADAIDYINLHGTSTRQNDLNETNSLKMALGDAARRIPMSSTKSYSGHLIGAAGSLEAIVCLKAIESGTVPATIHLVNPDPECDLDYTPSLHATGRNVDVAMNLSFGFGGTNCALVLEKYHSAAQRQRSEEA